MGMIGTLAMVILAPIAAMLVQMAISRTREYAADNLGARIAGRPDWLASALRKLEAAAHAIPNEDAERSPATAHMFIVNPLSGRGMDNLFATHPSTENRIAALEELARELHAGGGWQQAAAPRAPQGRHRDPGIAARPAAPADRGADLTCSCSPAVSRCHALRKRGMTGAMSPARKSPAAKSHSPHGLAGPSGAPHRGRHRRRRAAAKAPARRPARNQRARRAARARPRAGAHHRRDRAAAARHAAAPSGRASSSAACRARRRRSKRSC